MKPAIIGTVCFFIGFALGNVDPERLSGKSAPPDAQGAAAASIRMVRVSFLAEACRVRSREWTDTLRGFSQMALAGGVQQNSKAPSMGAAMAVGVAAAAKQEAEGISSATCRDLRDQLPLADRIVDGIPAEMRKKALEMARVSVN